ncbi:MAG: undecaprenyl-diphosphate phosphatase [Deltaproteobacteria bacterium]|nr:undecaprenyl-diphosphate phosphatase [Deltaproteobacteria bacterium]
MTLSQAVILGAVQGLGEFLPISSSAHLVITPWLLKFEDPGLAFDVALHFGTLLAIVFYFFKDWVQLISSGLGSLKKIFNKEPFDLNQKLFWYLFFASVPGAVLGYILEKHAETTFRSPLLIAATLSIMGIILWLTDIYSSKRKELTEIHFKESFLIGISQAIAIIPGVSRSGITITTGLLTGLTRSAAARFSFLLATPITFGACLVKSKDFFSSPIGLESYVGIAVSAIFGFLSIKFMLRYLQKFSYKIFVVYRLLFAALIVGVYFLRK